ncbi:MAG: long-chain fatty acid--CoA ligase [Microbacteriaceae bacterium]|nr:long-chain fatty acid--CoA ligase [Microbacteriaceae bacterium]
MREAHGLDIPDLDDWRNATELIERRLREAPEHIAFDLRDPGAPVTGPWREVTTREYAQRVRDVAKGLIADGVEAGDAIAIMAATSYDWAVLEQAAWHAGAIVVPVYATSAAVQVDAIVADSGAVAGWGDTDETAGLLRDALAAAGRDPARARRLDDASGGLDALAASGAGVDDAALEARRTAAGLDDIATIVYTSGTTAAPKGAQLAHRNIVGVVASARTGYSNVFHDRGSTVLFLPLAHILARAVQHVCFATGMRIAHVADPRDAVEALPVLRPTFLMVVPRVLEKVRAAAATAAESKRLGRVWAAADAAAVRRGGLEQTRDEFPRTRIPLADRLRHALFDRLFYGRLRDRLGGRIEWVLSGGGPLGADAALFFRGIGVPTIEGYGLTETTGPVTGNVPGQVLAGSVGVPLPGNSVRIADDGEVLVRGAVVFTGYRSPEATEAAFVDGWFRTGDFGRLDERGRLTLQGRRSDVIVTAGGKNVSPGDWERTVEADPLVAHAVVVGEGRPYLGALIVLDEEALAEWLVREGVDGPPPRGDDHHREVSLELLREKFEAAVAAANERVSRPEQVRRFRLLVADLSEAGGNVTATLKLKRKVFVQRLADEIDALYHDAGEALEAGARRARRAGERLRDRRR